MPVPSLAEEVNTLAAAIRHFYPDLEFLAPDGQLSIATDLSSVTDLRLQLPNTECLHLHSIAIEQTGLDDLVAGTTRRASSAWGPFGQTLADGVLFDPSDGHGTGFHTDRDERPWLEIEFHRPVSISRIVLRNVATATASRARGIQVLARVSGGEWQTLYDGHARIEAIQRGLEEMRLHRTSRDASLAGVDAAWLAPILKDVLVGDYKGAAAGLNARAELTAKEKGALRKVISTKILADRRLEWTIHGVHRSFRYWSKEERSRYVGTAVELANDLKGLTDKVSLGFGAVLATVRDGELIPHDDDIDLIVGFEPEEARTLADGIELIRRHLTPLGYNVRGGHMAHQWVAKPGRPLIDVFVGLFEGDNIAWYPGKRGSLTREMMYPTSTAPLLGHECPLPRSPLLYLEQVYGPTWRTPDPGFNHTWDRRAFSDIATEGSAATPAR